MSVLEVLLKEELAPVFWRPQLLDRPSAWFGHIPFAHWLITATGPRVLVELGTHAGVSYSAFCAAVENEHCGTQCFAIDTWAGDEHAGHYTVQIFEELERFNREHYGHFSSLLKCTFDEGLKRFKDKSIDVLHIDGLHTYEAVSHDFLTWLPKLSERAVVLFHDTNEYQEGFGVWRFWAEMCQRYPSFEFLHSHGLGVLAVGEQPPQAIAELCSANEGDKASLIRDRFQKLGSHWAIEAKLSQERKSNANQIRKVTEANSIAIKETQNELKKENLKALEQAKQESVDAINQLHTLTSELKRQIQAKEIEIQQALERAATAEYRCVILDHDKSTLLSSASWRITRPLRFLSAKMPGPVRRCFRSLAKIAWWSMTPKAMPERLRRRRVYKALASSSLFDPDWYHSQYPDVAAASVDPVCHYIDAGANEGRNPSAVFDTDFYKQQYPDVADANINPLYHYVCYGQSEGRQVVRTTPADAYTFSATEKSSSLEGVVKGSDTKIAVCFHCYYPDVALEIINYLKNIKRNYAIFITHSESLNSLILKELNNLNRDIFFLKTDNHGRDVKPFLHCLHHPEIYRFEFVLKIHTKRGETEVGNFWRQFFLKNIIGTTENFESILKQFQNDDELMLAGPKQAYISASRFMYGNQLKIEKLSNLLLDGFLLDDWGFFAGTMFWARRSLFDPLLNYEACGIRFDNEKGSTDGELEHAFERIFGLLPGYKGGKILLLEEGVRDDNKMTVITGIGSPSLVPITQTMKRLSDLQES